MKKLTLLWVLMIANGFGGASFALSNQAAAAGIARDGSSGGAVQRPGKERPLSVPGEMNQRNLKKLIPAGLTNDAEVKRVKMLLLLMITQGRHPTPVY